MIMAKNEKPTGLDMSSVRQKKSGKSVLHPLHEAALRIAEIGRGKSKSGTRELVAMLLTHGARAWRANQPPAKIHLHVTSPARCHPVWLRLPKVDLENSL